MCYWTIYYLDINQPKYQLNQFLQWGSKLTEKDFSRPWDSFHSLNQLKSVQRYACVCRLIQLATLEIRSQYIRSTVHTPIQNGYCLLLNHSCLSWSVIVIESVTVCHQRRQYYSTFQKLASSLMQNCDRSH